MPIGMISDTVELTLTPLVQGVETLTFDETRSITINPVTSTRYNCTDTEHRIHSNGEVKVVIDTNQPHGVFRIENMASHYNDYPELTIKLYKDNTNTPLGEFQLPYGAGATVHYKTDDVNQPNFPAGWWSMSMHVNDESILTTSSAHQDDQLRAGMASGAIYAKVTQVG